MDYEDIIFDLAYYDRFPENAIRAALDQGEELAPRFIKILEDHVNDKNQTIEEIDAHLEEEDALFLIIHILGELGDKRAFPLLMNLLARENDEVEAVLGEAITETLKNILISTYNGDKQHLYAVMDNDEIDAFIRNAVFSAWTYQVLTGAITRDEARDYLEKFPNGRQEQNGSFIWISWATAIAHLGFEELSEIVEAAFKDDRIETEKPGHIVQFASDFRNDLAEALSLNGTESWMRKKRYWPFENMIDVISKWHCFSKKYLDEFHRHAEEALADAQGLDDDDKDFDPDVLIDGLINPSLNSAAPGSAAYQQIDPFENIKRSVGRNDPCPCGSGKKYKKCCLQ